MKLEISKRAYSFVSSLDAKQFKQVMLKIMSLLKNHEQSDVSKLKGYNDYYRADIGEYRIVYKKEADDLIVDLIGKRNDDEVYKTFNRIVK